MNEPSLPLDLLDEQPKVPTRIQPVLPEDREPASLPDCATASRGSGLHARLSRLFDGGAQRVIVRPKEPLACVRPETTKHPARLVVDHASESVSDSEFLEFLQDTTFISNNAETPPRDGCRTIENASDYWHLRLIQSRETHELVIESIAKRIPDAKATGVDEINRTLTRTHEGIILMADPIRHRLLDALHRLTLEQAHTRQTHALLLESPILRPIPPPNPGHITQIDIPKDYPDITTCLEKTGILLPGWLTVDQLPNRRDLLAIAMASRRMPVLIGAPGCTGHQARNGLTADLPSHESPPHATGPVAMILEPREGQYVELQAPR